MIGLLLSTAYVQAQDENTKIDVIIELRPDGRGHIEVSARGPPVREVMEGLAQVPITGASLSIGISSPSSGRLDIEADGSITLRGKIIENLPPEAQLALHITPEQVNLMLNQFKGKRLSEIFAELRRADFGMPELPPELAEIKIEDFSCTKFSWSEPKLAAAFSLKLSGMVFENEEILGELPIGIDASLSTSATGMTLTIGLDGKKVDGGLELVLAADRTAFHLDTTFDPPKVGDRVQWGLRTPEMWMIRNLADLNLVDEVKFWEKLENSDFTLTLRVPSGAAVSLPSGYSQVGDTYTWSGDEAVDALGQVLTGQAEISVEYGYTPHAEFPWLAVGVLIAVIIAAAIVVITLRARR